MVQLDPSNPVPKPIAGQSSSLIQTRLGVYLSWSLPRGYRSGRSRAPPSATDSTAAGTTPAADSPVPQQPTFLSVPNRWVIVRVLNELNGKPVNSNSPDRLKAFIVESDVLRKVDDLPSTVDIEADVAPFVYYDQSMATSTDILNQQASIFIGRTSSLDGTWQENSDPNTTIDLNVMQSSNPFFVDYQHHNTSVFS